MSGVSWWCLRDFGQVWGTGMYDTKLLVKFILNEDIHIMPFITESSKL